MSNDFFDNHPMLGNMFDFDRDGSLDAGEAAFMGAIFSGEANGSSEKPWRDRRPWDDDPDIDDDHDGWDDDERSIWDD